MWIDEAVMSIVIFYMFQLNLFSLDSLVENMRHINSAQIHAETLATTRFQLFKRPNHPVADDAIQSLISRIDALGVAQ